MIAAPRVLFVTRRFWPLANDNMWRLLALADALQTNGWQPQILTAQWHSAWPEKVELRDLAIQRLGPSPTTPFRSRRYVRGVCEWTNNHAGLFDCIVIDATEEDAVALTLRSMRDAPPVIVRYDTVESGGPLMERLHQRIVTACSQAAHVVVPHQHAQRELVSAGVALTKISIIADGPYRKIDCEPVARGQARRALADINYELALRADDRLCICPCEMNRAAGLELLARALGTVLESRRDARCWILGDGPERGRMVELLRREGWHSDILMPGTFEDLELIFQAADLCVLPGASHGLSWIMPTALTNGLTTLVCDSPAARSRLGLNSCPILFEQGNTQQLCQKVESVLDHPKSWRAATQAAAEPFQLSPSPIAQWLRLIRQFERSGRDA